MTLQYRLDPQFDYATVPFLPYSPPSPESSLQQRPLNAYVPANAVHVKTANRSIIVDGSLVGVLP